MSEQQPPYDDDNNLDGIRSLDLPVKGAFGNNNLQEKPEKPTFKSQYTDKEFAEASAKYSPMISALNSDKMDVQVRASVRNKIVSDYGEAMANALMGPQ